MGHVLSTPQLGDAHVDGEQPVGVVVDEPLKPTFEVLRLRGIAEAHALHALTQLPNDEHGQKQVLVGHPQEP